MPFVRALRENPPAGASLDVHLSVRQHRGTRVPPAAVHVVLAREGVRRVIEEVAVVVADVGGAGAVPGVATRDEHVAALGQHQRGTAEEVRARAICQRMVATVEAAGGVPDVVMKSPSAGHRSWTRS